MPCTSLLSLDTADLALYRAMVLRDSVTVEEAALAVGDLEPGLPVTRAALDRLTDLHLVGRTELGGVARYHPLSPAAAEAAGVEDILRAATDVERQISQARSLLRTVNRVYEDHRHSDGGAVTTHREPADVNGAIRQAARQCRGQFLTFQPGGSRARPSSDAALPPTLTILDSSVETRAIYQHSARASPATQELVRDIRAKGGDARTLNEPFERLLVFDRTVAFLPCKRDGRATIEVRQPSVVDFLADVFERAWLRAQPFAPPTRGRATTQISDELSIAIMRHVVAGDTDAVTAQQLGISVRRCQEYIARIATRLGSRSRAQLGFLVAQSGLLEDG